MNIGGIDPCYRHCGSAARGYGVFGTGTGWPDLIAAVIVGGLGLWGGWQIVPPICIRFLQRKISAGSTVQ
jgi:hypothetical protein